MSREARKHPEHPNSLIPQKPAQLLQPLRAFDWIEVVLIAANRPGGVEGNRDFGPGKKRWNDGF